MASRQELDAAVAEYNRLVLAQQTPVAAGPASLPSTPQRPLPASNIPIPMDEATRTRVAQSIAGTPIQRAVELGNQAAAGLMETVVPSPQAQQELGPVAGNLPSFLWDLASLPALLERGMMSFPVDPTGITGDERSLEDVGATSMSEALGPLAELVMQSPGRYAQSTREWTNQQLDLEDPQNLGESLFRNLSVPIPTRAGPRLLTELGSMVLPLGTARSAPAILAEQLIPGFIDATIRSGIDPLYGTSGQARTDRAVELYNMAATVANGGSPDPMRVGDVHSDFEIPEDESGQTGLYVLGAIGALLGAGGLSAAGAAIRRSRYQSQVVDASTFMGRPEKLETGDSVARIEPANLVNEGPIADRTIVSRIADRNAPLHEVTSLLDGIGQRTQDVMHAQIAVLGAPHGRGGAINTAIRFGLELFGLKMPAVERLARFIYALPRDVHMKFADTYRALHNQDVMRQAGAGPGTIWKGRTTAQDLTFADMQRIASDPTVLADPRFNQYAQGMMDIADAISDLQVRLGSKTVAQAQADRVMYPHYIPTQLNVKNPQGMSKVGRQAVTVGGVPIGSMKNPFDDLSGHLARLAHAVAKNDIKRNIHGFGSRHLNMRTKDGKPVIERGAPKPHEKGAFLSQHYAGGKLHDFTIRDSSLAHAMKLDPNHAWGLLNTARIWHQQFTTGYFNPLFVLNSALYDTIATIMLRRKGEGTGLLDQITRSVIGKPLSSVIGFDPTSLFSALTGGVAGTMVDVMAGIRNGVERSLVSNGVIAQVLGVANATKFAAIITNALEKSMVYTHFKKYAGDSPDIVADFSRGSRSVFSDAEFERGGPLAGLRYNRLTRAGKLLIRNLQNGTRIQHALANRPLQLKSLNVRVGGLRTTLRWYAPAGDENDYLIAGAKTRRSNVDVAQVGFDPHTKLGRFGQGLVSSIPYANHSIRAIADHIKAMRENPTGYFMTLAGLTSATMIYLIEQTESSPEFAQFFWHDMTANQRTMGVPFLGEGGDIAALVAVAPELRLVLGPLTEVVGTLMGYKARQEDLNLVDGVLDIRRYVRQALVPGWSDLDTEDVSQALVRGIGSVNPLSVPGIFGAGLSMLGVQPPELALGRFGAQSYPDIRGQPDLNSDVVRGVEGVLEGLVGASAQPLVAMMHSMIGSLRLDEEHGGTALGEDIVRSLSAFAGAYDDPRKYTVLSSLFDAEYRLSVADSTFHIVNNKLQTLESLLALGQEYIDNPGLTKENAPGTLLSELDLRGTDLASIYLLLKSLNSQLDRTRSDIANIKDERAELPFASRIEQPDGSLTSTADRDVRTALDNRLAQRSRYLHTYALDILRDYEAQISQALGRPFVLESSDVQSESLAEATPAPRIYLPSS